MYRVKTGGGAMSTLKAPLEGLVEGPDPAAGTALYDNSACSPSLDSSNLGPPIRATSIQEILVVD